MVNHVNVSDVTNRMVVTLGAWLPPQRWVSACESYRGYYRCVVTRALGPVMVGKQMYNGNAVTRMRLTLRCWSAARQLITTLLLALLSLETWPRNLPQQTCDDAQWSFTRLLQLQTIQSLLFSYHEGPLQHELSLPAYLYLPHTLHTLSTKPSSP